MSRGGGDGTIVPDPPVISIPLSIQWNDKLQKNAYQQAGLIKWKV
jgi:hypothetical protein